MKTLARRGFALLAGLAIGALAAHVGINAFEAPQPRADERLVVYEPVFLTHAVDVSSPGDRYTAGAAGGAANRVEAGRVRSLDVLRISRGPDRIVSLYQYSDAGTAWSEFGRIDWVAPTTARFSYRGGSQRFESFIVDVSFDE